MVWVFVKRYRSWLATAVVIAGIVAIFAYAPPSYLPGALGKMAAKRDLSLHESEISGLFKDLERRARFGDQEAIAAVDRLRRSATGK